MTRPSAATPRRRLAAVALTVVLAVGLSACGGDPETPGDGAGGATADPPGTAQAVATDKVDIKDFNFAPQAVKVKAGQSVTWTNQDSFDHTATAEDRSYDSGNLAQGKTFSHRYERPGTYDYFCAIHNSMVGTVTVE